MTKNNNEVPLSLKFAYVIYKCTCVIPKWKKKFDVAVNLKDIKNANLQVFSYLVNILENISNKDTVKKYSFKTEIIKLDNNEKMLIISLEKSDELYETTFIGILFNKGNNRCVISTNGNPLDKDNENTPHIIEIVNRRYDIKEKLNTIDKDVFTQKAKDLFNKPIEVNIKEIISNIESKITLKDVALANFIFRNNFSTILKQKELIDVVDFEFFDLCRCTTNDNIFMYIIHYLDCKKRKYDLKYVKIMNNWDNWNPKKYYKNTTWGINYNSYYNSSAVQKCKESCKEESCPYKLLVEILELTRNTTFTTSDVLNYLSKYDMELIEIAPYLPMPNEDLEIDNRLPVPIGKKQKNKFVGILEEYEKKYPELKKIYDNFAFWTAMFIVKNNLVDITRVGFKNDEQVELLYSYFLSDIKDENYMNIIGKYYADNKHTKTDKLDLTKLSESLENNEFERSIFKQNPYRIAVLLKKIDLIENGKFRPLVENLFEEFLKRKEINNYKTNTALLVNKSIEVSHDILTYIYEYSKNKEMPFIDLSMLICAEKNRKNDVKNYINSLNKIIRETDYIKRSRIEHYSAYYIMSKDIKISDIYAKLKRGILAIDISGLKDINYEGFFKKLNVYRKKEIFIILYGNREDILILEDRHRIEYILKFKDINETEVFNLVIDKFKEYNMTKEFQTQLKEYIVNTYNSEEDITYYVDNLYKKIIFNNTKMYNNDNYLKSDIIPIIKNKRKVEQREETAKQEISQLTEVAIKTEIKDEIIVKHETLNQTTEIEITAKTKDEIKEELKKIIGLDNIKVEIEKLIAYLDFIYKIKSEKNLGDVKLHMVFKGNPGTGKTTIARIIAKMLHELGYVSKNRLTEVTGKDLIGEYVGHTAPKTQKVIESALDGVLFIDEAYTLANPHFGNECIATLLKAMEDYKDRLVIIFAGYKTEMEEFLQFNPGLLSRIGYNLEFKDYTKEELIKIFESKLEKENLQITSNAENEVINTIEQAMKRKDFGNARFVENMYQKIILEHALNTENVEDMKELLTITENDITENIIKELKEHKKIGF